MTFAQKVLSRASGETACTGDIVNAKVDLAMSHENSALVLKAFREIGAKKIWDPSKVVILFDHRIPANTIKAAEGHKEVRTFARGELVSSSINTGQAALQKPHFMQFMSASSRLWMGSCFIQTCRGSGYFWGPAHA
jgi:homoaconitase/3-isopropylmalate dehydratase large subunit